VKHKEASSFLKVTLSFDHTLVFYVFSSDFINLLSQWFKEKDLKVTWARKAICTKISDAAENMGSLKEICEILQKNSVTVVHINQLCMTCLGRN